MRKPIKPAVSQFAGLRNLSDKAKAQLMASPDAPGPEPLPLAPAPAATPEPSTAPETPKRGRGRPRGNKSDPNYMPVTIQMHQDTRWGALHALSLQNRQNRTKQTFSELIEQLLIKWTNENWEKPPLFKRDPPNPKS